MIKQWLFKGQLTRGAQIVVAGAALALMSSLFLPIWKMTMVSNQYPEGLHMWIYASRMRGDLQEINILNHYIGMQPLSAENFAELRVLPYVFGLGALVCLAAALIRRRAAAALALAGGVATGLGSMGVLVYELYRYGHTLDPRAPIDVQPFMPLPMGSTQLANFHVTTYLHVGSLMFMLAVGGLIAALWISRPRQAAGLPAARETRRPAAGRM